MEKKMTWNYRAIKTTHQDGTELVGIHEVHYTGLGTLESYTTNAVEVDGDTIEELGNILGMMTHALTKPVLTPADFPVAA
jgi:hypothetical protein